ncbi:MAG: FAD-containing oxidoreductase [Candidatus Aminicenantes bacterium]|nr:FAD-containing oxidoreductase [Candidatus Aminicenantes bacterium]
MIKHISLPPEDEYNLELLQQVHPPDWINPEPESVYNLLVVGLGTAGLVAAIGAAGMGARVAVVEDYLMGGDCLNFGCVPSKAVIRSSRVVGEIQRAADFGVKISGGAEVDFAQVMQRMRRLRARISHHDSYRRLVDLGVDVYFGEGHFRDGHCFVVDDKSLRFKRALVATGARPSQPIIPGLKTTGYLTNETVFSLIERPDDMVIIGGGPIGCELAQAFNRLGCRITIIQRNEQLLPREDADAAELLAKVFERENIRVLLGADIQRISEHAGKKQIHVCYDRKDEVLLADEVLVSSGRIPNVENLGLEAAGVEYDLEEGVKINDYLQTTNPAVYAAGDVCFPFKFTHIADATARIVIQNALFLRSKKHRSLTIPWCIYTEPEIAHVGLCEKELQTRNIPFDTFIKGFEELDRAILDGEDQGFVKVHVKKGKDKILGATIVARHAGEMISQVTQAMVSGAGLKTLNNVIHPYPTQSEALRQVAAQYYVEKFSPALKKWLIRWFRWRR